MKKFGIQVDPQLAFVVFCVLLALFVFGVLAVRAQADSPIYCVSEQSGARLESGAQIALAYRGNVDVGLADEVGARLEPSSTDSNEAGAIRQFYDTTPDAAYYAVVREGERYVSVYRLTSIDGFVVRLALICEGQPEMTETTPEPGDLQ